MSWKLGLIRSLVLSGIMAFAWIYWDDKNKCKDLDDVGHGISIILMIVVPSNSEISSSFNILYLRHGKYSKYGFQLHFFLKSVD